MSDIRKQKAKYMIALKKNQGKLFDEAENFFNQAIENEEYAPCVMHRTEERSRDRKEEHEVWVTEELDWLDVQTEWQDLRQLILVKRTREQNGKISVEKRYYIASGANSAEKLGELARGHWAIENKYHWHLDVTFREDASQIGAAGNRNLRVARNIALQMLKAKPVKGMSYRRQMKKCARSDAKLREFLLVGNFSCTSPDTSITQGKKLVIVVGSKKAIMLAIQNQEVQLRHSGLRQIIAELITSKAVK